MEGTHLPWVCAIMGEPVPLNELTIPYVEDALCYIPIGLLMKFSKIRPVQKSGVLKMKAMIIAAGYQNSSVIKVKVPANQEEHVHWGLDIYGITACKPRRARSLDHTYNFALVFATLDHTQY